MQIEVKGRNTPVTDELREHVEKRFTKVGKQVSEFARLEIEVYEERNPAIADNQVAEATLALKGVTLRAHDRARDLRHAINLCEEELSRQVKRHREKRRGRRKVGTESIRTATEPEGFGEGTAIATQQGPAKEPQPGDASSPRRDIPQALSR
jgi:ribosome hibernation promoting factor